MSVRAPWADGSSRIGFDRESGASVLTMAIECRVEGLAGKQVALLDTGAQWSILGGGLAETLLAARKPSGETLRLSSRLGVVSGTLERVRISLLSELGCGSDLDVDATVLLAPVWTGPVVLGTRGLLERVRFEIDPDQTGNDSWWSFAAGNR